MMIRLEDSILIFDEAHNMEDAAREAASLTINSNQLKEVEEEIDKISKDWLTLHVYIQAYHLEASYKPYTQYKNIENSMIMCV